MQMYKRGKSLCVVRIILKLYMISDVKLFSILEVNY
jgi:hypothetical protein